MAKLGRLKIIDRTLKARDIRQPDPDIGKAVLRATAAVHAALGPGLGRTAYSACFQRELENAGYHVTPNVPVPVTIRDMDPVTGFVIDLLIEDSVMIVFSDEQDEALRQITLRNYMRHSGRDFGFMVCFNVSDIRKGLIQASRRMDSAQGSVN